MGFIFDTVFWELLLGASLMFFLFYIYSTSNFTYWKNRSIAYEKPSFPFGTDKDLVLFKQSIGSHFQRIYNKFKGAKVVGMFALDEPYLLIRDPELLRQILTKDFNHFVDRGIFDPETLHPVNRHLAHMNGESWKIMRHKLTPAFTSGKMKLMYSLVEACCDQLILALKPIAEQNGNFSVKHFLACFTTDVIASCAFGLESNSIKNPDNEFRANGDKIVAEPTLQLLKQRLFNAYPKIYRLLPFRSSMETSGAEDFFLNIVGDTVEYRQKNYVARNDFMDILIKLKNNKNLFAEEENGHIDHQKEATNDGAG